MHGWRYHRNPLHGLELQGSGRQFVLDLLLSVRCLLFGGKALPFVAALAVFIFVGVADAVRELPRFVIYAILFASSYQAAR